MRLRDERIESIAQQILEALTTKRLVKITKLPLLGSGAIARVIIKDLAFEDQIDAEAEEIIASMKRGIPEGSSEWHSIFRQKKDELMDKYNYVI